MIGLYGPFALLGRDPGRNLPQEESMMDPLFLLAMWPVLFIAGYICGGIAQ